MSINNIYAFISLWDKKFGPKVITAFPKSIKSSMDLDLISSKIFFAFQEFYYSNDEKNRINRTFFKLTINDINRKAIILLDSFEQKEINEDYQSIFIIVLLFPAHLSDNELDKFKNIMYEICTEYKRENKVMFEKYYSNIEELYSLEESFRDSDIFIDDTYSLNDALRDFQKGIDQYSKTKYNYAYRFLKKAYLKFSSENSVKLLLEDLFFLCSTLSKVNKYIKALDYIKELEILSNKLRHQKYYETSLFMGGFCFYKIEDYEKALKKFKKLESMELKYIDKFNFYFIYGQTFELLEINSNAFVLLQKALDISIQIKDSEQDKDKKAQLLFELGQVSYKVAIEFIISRDFNQELYKSKLEKSIKYYEEAIEVYKELNNFKSLISIYRLIGNIYEIFGNHELAIKNYRDALKLAEEINDVINRLQIFNLIIQNLSKLKKYDIVVQEIDSMLSKIISYAYLDLFTISKYHQYLGEALFNLGNYKDALAEFLISLNIYNKFDQPILESLKILKLIIKVYNSYENEENKKYIEYYNSQYDQLAIKINELKSRKELPFDLLKNIKEFWIFTIDGKQLFSYAPETKFKPELFGGFLTALQSFSIELTSHNLNSIMIGSSNYTFFSEDTDFYVIGRSSIKAPSDDIEITLKAIYKEFWKNYSHVLKDFNGDISQFSNFFELIEEKNKNPTKI